MSNPVMEAEAAREGIPVEVLERHRQIMVAALNEAGVPARLADRGMVRTPAGYPCELRYRASTIARRATGQPLQTIEEWHEYNRDRAIEYGHRWTCECGMHESVDPWA